LGLDVHVQLNLQQSSNFKEYNLLTHFEKYKIKLKKLPFKEILAKDPLIPVFLPSFSTPMFASLTRRFANQCYSSWITKSKGILHINWTFSNSFFDLNNYKVVSSTDIRKNETWSFVSTVAVDIHFMLSCKMIHYVISKQLNNYIN